MDIRARLEFQRLRYLAGLSFDEAADLIYVSERQARRYEDISDKGCDPSPLVLEAMRGAARWNERVERVDPDIDPLPAPQFKFVDLFAGIGGLRIPFQAREIGGKCVFSSEWDRFSRITYEKNFRDDHKEHVFAGDIRPYAKKPSLIPKHDVLLAGFPCQPFSIAGVSKKNALGRPHGFLCDTQGTLFYDLAEIIKHHKPAAFLLENVKNLESHDGGRTFTTIMHVLKYELGYKNLHHRLISSAPWVPQRRERIFIVGFKHDNNFDFDDLVIPAGKRPVLGDILERSPPAKYTLTQHMWTYLQSYKEKHQRAGNGFGCSVFGPNDIARTLSARYYKDGSEVLIEQRGRPPRRLTPRECARLMGFDQADKEFEIPVSDTQAYRQFGNAVVVPVVRAVAKLMAPHIHAALQAEVVESTELRVASG